MTLRCLKLYTIILVCFLCTATRLAAQEPVPGKGAPENLIQRTLVKDIETAGYFELVAWCRDLGLNDAGTRQALQQRLYGYYRVSPPSAEEPQEDRKRLLEIKSAKETQYFTIEQVDENYVLLLGDVLVEIQEQDATHRIRAHQILLNQTENILSAEGGIEYTLIKGSEEEVFRGQRLTFNVDTWEGVFFGGGMEVDRSVSGETIRFQFSGESISKLEGNTVIIDKGRITSCDAEGDPHYHIRARKIWVLAPNEWAILHAVLYVGRVPLLYLPFFFRPGDEFFFHPAIGYRDREGYFVQTTTYLIGQKKRSSSAMSFLAATEESTTQFEVERSGLFLRQIPDKPIQVDDNRFLKVMLDFYSRLGGFAGVEGSFPKVDFKGGLAFSRTVYEDTVSLAGGGQALVYTPWVVENNFDSSWNWSYFFGTPLPFRFGVESSWNIGSGPFSLSGKFEYFTDPYFTSDFYNRSEDAGLTRLVGLEPIQDTATEGITSSLTWELSAKTDFSGKIDTPLVKTVSFPYITANLLWQSKDNAAMAEPDDDFAPSRKFYYPVSLKLPSASFQMLGDLLSIDLPSIKVQSSEDSLKPAGESVPVAGRMRVPGLMADATADTPPGVQPVAAGQEAGQEMSSPLRLPEPKDSVPVSLQKKPLQFDLSYQLRPAVTVEQSFNSENWDQPEEVTYDLKYTSFDTKGIVSLDHNLRILENVFLWNGSLALTGNYRSRVRQSFPVDTDWQNLVVGDQQYSQLNLRTTHGLDYYPLADDPIFGNTALSYDLSWIFYRYVRDEALATWDNPVYRSLGLGFSSDTVSRHTAQAALRWKMFQKDSSLSLSTQMYPLQGNFTGNLELRIWLLTTTVNSVFQDTASANDWGDFSDWSFQPLVLRESLQLGDNFTLSEELRFDFETYQDQGSGLLAKSLTSLNWGSFAGSYTMDYMMPQQFNFGSEAWEDAPGAKALLPSFVTLSYNLAGRERLYWKNRIRIGSSFNTSWSMNIQQFTDNSLDFSLTFDFWLYRFLNLSITTSSYNNRTYQYFPGMASELGQEAVNPIEDLLKSFDFFTKNSRKNREDSAFNLRSITVEATHYLHDWNLSLNYEGKPTLDTDTQRYEWRSSFAIILQWLPIPEIRSNPKVEWNETIDDYLFSLRG